MHSVKAFLVDLLRSIDFEGGFRVPMMTPALLLWHSFLRWPSRFSRRWMWSHLPTSSNPSHVHPALNPLPNIQALSQSPRFHPQMYTQMQGRRPCRLIQALMEKCPRIWQFQPAAGLIVFPVPHFMGVQASSCSNRMISLLLLVIGYRTPLPLPALH